VAPGKPEVVVALLNSMHITGSVFINDDEAGLHHDFGVWLEKLARFNPHRPLHARRAAGMSRSPP
jgi:thiamine phosphate synthase YjbQ (UPF0047 family)